MLHVTPSSIPLAFDLARQHYQAAQFGRAAEICRDILAVEPRHAPSLHLAGVAARHANQPAEAIDFLQRAAALEPRSPEIAYDLAHALQTFGDSPAALTHYRSAIALRQAFPEAHDGLGNVLAALGRTSEAIDAYLEAIIQRPHFAQAWNNLGNVLLAEGRRERSIEAYSRAADLNPALYEAHVGLGAALLSASRTADAIAALRQAIALRPDLPEAYNNLGTALMESGELAEAAAACTQAIAIRPAYAEAYSNLGNVLRKQEKIDDAVAAYRHAIALRPEYPEALANLAGALIVLSQFDEALTLFRSAIEIKPDFAGAQNLLFCLQYLPGDDPEFIYREHAKWNQRYAAHLAGALGPLPNDHDPHRRLRVGYVSPDFRDHCQSFFTVPLLSAHDHSHFEIFCYADVPHPDAFTARLRAYADVWRDTAGMTDLALAELIRADHIDILVDLTMHMAKGRPGVFARKAALIQVAWLAYPGTTGLTAIDYRLSDPHLDPPGLNDAYYSEKTVRLPDTFWCYDPLADADEFPVTTLPALGNGHITFGCLNNFAKINEPTLRLWARVLAAVPDARLLLLAPRGHLRAEVMDALGIGPQRIDFIDRCPRADYLRAYQRIDLCLDTFPYNGHTTSLDALWMGVPAVTLVGRTAVARAGLSQMTNLAMDEFVAHLPDEFVAIAQRWAENWPKLAGVRAGLREKLRQSPLMDGPRFARHVEQAFHAMWTQWYADRPANAPG